MSSRVAKTDHPVHALIASRWSPYVIAAKSVPSEDLHAVFEAARWAASSYNEQPWRYIVGVKDDSDAWERVLSSLVEPNQAWARSAPVLALGVISTQFARNGKPNKAAQHDLGLASAQLTLEATARGLVVHQMIGIVPDRARELHRIPEGFDPLTALAIGYPGDPASADEGLADRDRGPRERRALAEFVFGGTWGQRASWLSG